MIGPVSAARVRTTHIVIHCSGTPPTSDVGAQEIDDWHKGRGWSGIGYAAVIRRDGTIEWGRHPDAVGAHVQGWNTRAVGICLVGGVNAAGKPEPNFTDEQSASLRALVRTMIHSYPDAQVVGHRDLSPDLDGDGIVEKHEWLKACPSFDVRWWLAHDRFVLEVPAGDRDLSRG